MIESATSCGWLWMYAGAALMLFEIAMPGFVVFFFGLAAATTGALRLALGEAFSPAWQMAAMSVFSILYLVFLRRALKNILTGDSETSRADFAGAGCTGRAAKVVKAIEPPLAGRVLLGDAEWDATSAAPLAEGENVVVVAQDNLTLRVAPLSDR